MAGWVVFSGAGKLFKTTTLWKPSSHAEPVLHTAPDF